VATTGQCSNGTRGFCSRACVCDDVTRRPAIEPDDALVLYNACEQVTNVNQSSYNTCHVAVSPENGQPLFSDHQDCKSYLRIVQTAEIWRLPLSESQNAVVGHCQSQRTMC
jgi:hypothetical protein